MVAVELAELWRPSPGFRPTLEARGRHLDERRVDVLHPGEGHSEPRVTAAHEHWGEHVASVIGGTLRQLGDSMVGLYRYGLALLDDRRRLRSRGSGMIFE